MSSRSTNIATLGAMVAAGVVAGVLIAGGAGLTPRAEAERTVVAAAPTVPAGTVDFAALAERVVPSVVSVYSTDIVERGEREQQMPMDFFHFFGPRQQVPRDRDEPMVRQGAGSGFFISSDGEVITNNHVVDGADKVEIELTDGIRYTVKVVGRDPATDLAVLRVEEPDREFPVLELGDSEALRVGEWVMAVGNPLNMDHTVTVGVVSAKGRVLGLSDSSFENYIQTDAAINLGNSGGPLVNVSGEVVGINTAVNAVGQNLAFAVPVATLRRVLPQLEQHGKVVRGYLGAQVRNVDPETREAFGLPSRDGAFVESVVPRKAADRAGIRAGDVIVGVQGEKVDDNRDLIDTVSSFAPGTTVRVEVLRDGKRQTLEATLEARPTGDEEEAGVEAPAEDASAGRVGLSVGELDARARQVYGVEEDLEGVVVTHVRRVSPAGEEGLRRGDVITQANGRPVRSAADLTEQVRAVPAGGYLRLYVYRPQADQSFFAIIKLGE